MNFVGSGKEKEKLQSEKIKEIKREVKKKNKGKKKQTE